MKKTLRVLILAACLAALAGIAAARALQASVSLLNARLVSGEELAAITALPETSAEDCVLHWNQAVLPYDAGQDVYCLPQPLDGSATGSLSASWGSVYLPADQWADGWQDAMADGRALDVYVSDGKRWCRLEILVCGLPVLVIDTERSDPYHLDQEEVGYTMASLPLAYNYGTMRLFWPEGNARAQVQSSGVEWHWRGNASLFSRKKSYRLNLLDSRERDTSMDLLGLGEENGWILVNFSTDCTRVRDKVANDLWNELAAQSGSNPAGAELEYVELYLDDTYMGVYGLCRSLSRKSMELSSQDVLYKWRQAQLVSGEDFDQLESEQSTECSNKLEVVWPNVWEPGVWEPLREYVDKLFLARDADWEQIEALANIDNLVDMALFKQYVCAVDNLLQNQYFLYRSQEERFYRLPWDMNYSFGDCYDKFLAEDLTTTPVRDLELDALYAADPRRTRQLVADRWRQLRETVFDLEHLEELFRAESEILAASGAFGRDYALWGEVDAYQGLSQHQSLQMDQTMEFMTERLVFLDGYMADFAPADLEVFDVLSK